MYLWYLWYLRYIRVPVRTCTYACIRMRTYSCLGTCAYVPLGTCAHVPVLVRGISYQLVYQLVLVIDQQHRIGR